MNGIAEISAVNAALLPEAALATSVQHTSFTQQMVAGLERVDDNLKKADDATTSFAIGEDIPPHEVMLALEDARMSLQLAVQVRNHLIEGYQELMRMQM